jgi:hypothetical protein
MSDSTRSGRLAPKADAEGGSGGPVPKRALAPISNAANLMALQSQAGNTAVSRLIRAAGRSPSCGLAVQRHSEATLAEQLEGAQEQETVALQRTGTVGRGILPVQRHSQKALDQQLEEAQEQEEAQALQRSALGWGAASRRPRPMPVQRHSMPLPRNRLFMGSKAVSDAQMAATIRVIDKALTAITSQLRIKFPDRAAILTRDICKKITDKGMGLESPAAADPSGTSFQLYVRSPFFYNEDGTPDSGFIRAVLIHESIHCISHDHTGLQEVEFITKPAGGGQQEERSTIGNATTPNDSLDEAMTERLSHQIFELLYGNKSEEYKTNYWQSVSDAGFHKTVDGLQSLTNRPYKEKNWTADLATLVEKEGVLTKEQLEVFYLKGEAGLRQMDADAPDRFRQRYADILKKWQVQKEAAWKAELPPGVLPASEWVVQLTKLLSKAEAWKYTEAQAVDYVTSATKGHELVLRTDPRSHLYRMAKPTYPDDIEILKTFYSNTRRDAPDVKTALPAGQVMPKEPTRWKGTNASKTKNKHDAAKIAVEAAAQSQKLGLNGDYPHILIPDRDTLGRTPFGSTNPADIPYEAYVRGPNLPDVSNESMTSVSGVDPDAKADFVIGELGGGAYEMNKKVIFTKTAEPRTLLHEIGHYKQDLAQTNEATVNTKLLEYHNIVMYENRSSLGPSTADSLVRLTYTRSPMVHLQKDWVRILEDPPNPLGDPPEFALVKKVVSGREVVALRDIEHQLTDARGVDKAVVYTPSMRWYLKRQLALEYLAKKYQKF